MGFLFGNGIRVKGAAAAAMAAAQPERRTGLPLESVAFIGTSIGLRRSGLVTRNLLPDVSYMIHMPLESTDRTVQTSSATPLDPIFTQARPPSLHEGMGDCTANADGTGFFRGKDSDPMMLSLSVVCSATKELQRMYSNAQAHDFPEYASSKTTHSST